MMRKILVLLATMLALHPLSTWAQSVSAAKPLAKLSAAKAPIGSFTDLTPAMVDFADTSAGLSDAALIAAFHARFDPVLPGYFDGKGDAQPQADASIIQKLRAFPDRRAKFIATAAAFRTAFDRGQAHFRAAFPDYRLPLPVYLVHSMGQQDGGTRTVAGRTIMFFGADVIAQIHDEATIGPFLDHELFHAYHGQYFPDCDQLWCSLWEEGLATYVASRLNPGADDRQLLLMQPRPIRPEVEPRLAEAMCGLAGKLQSTGQDDYELFFLGRSGKGSFPPRYGYLLGYLLAQSIGETMSLTELAKLPPAKVEPLLKAAIERYGPCGTTGEPAHPKP